jgi:hypothetical protein
VRHESFNCIYSGASVDPESFELDHFLPWTFVCHNSLWNLVPVMPEVNSAKKERLPDNVYLEPFVETQHRGLKIAHRVLARDGLERVISAFVGELRIGKDHLLELGALRDAYDKIVRPQLDIARGIGFLGGWRWAQ